MSNVMEEVVERKDLQGGALIIEYNLEQLLEEKERKAGSVVFDLLRVKLQSSGQFARRLYLISTNDKGEEEVTASFKSGYRYGGEESSTIYPDNLKSKFTFSQLQILDRIKIQVKKLKQQEEYKVEEVEKEDIKELLLEIDGVGEKTADKVITKVLTGEMELNDISHISSEAKEKIRENFNNVKPK